MLNILNSQIEFINYNYEQLLVGFQAWVQGILFILFLYHFLFFFQNRNLMFLYYSAFVFCLFIYFALYNHTISYIPNVSSSIITTLFYGIQFLAYFFYISYVREVVQTKIFIPKWDKVLRIAKKALLLFILIIPIASHFLNSSEMFRVVSFLFCAITFFAFINYFVFYRIKGIPVKLLIIGSITYLILTNITLFYSIYNNNNRLKFSPIVFMEIGAIIESLIFALIVGYKTNEIEKEKNNVQIQLLEKSVEASELKMVALRAQMNPHFIFNALNSINNFILKKEKEKASDYLTKFAKLIRNTLRYSSETTITLKDEIETIKTYMKLEQLRIESGFDFVINNSQQLNLDLIKIPPLILQPYIENAIWHGLNSKEDSDKKIEIFINSKHQTHFIIKIKDNGIGRVASAKLNSKFKKSYGTKITKERIKMVYPNSTVHINDVCSKKNSSIIKGTIVSISIIY